MDAVALSGVETDAKLDLRIEDLRFRREHNRITNVLRDSGCYTVRDLLQYGEGGLMRLPNLGRISLGVIDEALREIGLGVNFPSVPATIVQARMDQISKAELLEAISTGVCRALKQLFSGGATAA